MTDWAPPIEKVTALITRRGTDRPELLVFDHGLAGVQLPAGTVEPGERFDEAALREAWEETGALGLELAGELGVLRRPFVGARGAFARSVAAGEHEYSAGTQVTLLGVHGDDAHVQVWDGTRALVEASSIARSDERHLFHLRATIAMPDEWQVLTGDNGFSSRTCFWVPIEDAPELLHENQRDWIDAVREALDDSADRDRSAHPRPPLPAGLGGPGSWEEFWAAPFADRRFVMSFDAEAVSDVCTRARALCVTPDGGIVLVGGPQGHFDVPGGGREPGETIEENLAREVREEACCRIVSCEYLTALRGVMLGADGAAAGVDRHALFWARVEVDVFDPQFETTQRRIVTPTEAVEISNFPDTIRMLLELAAPLDEALVWDPEVGP